jgi:ABC-type antimicrobial peptide transport system permease subunit
VIASLDPQLVMYKPMALTEAIGRGEAQRVFTLRLLTTFAGVALGLAALGLFGVLSYGVRLRRREFGIRMALGANGGSIRRMVLREGMVVTAIGVVIGLLGAVALSRVLASLVFGVSTLDPRCWRPRPCSWRSWRRSRRISRRIERRRSSRVPCCSRVSASRTSREEGNGSN